jgi:hypothetical protein
MDRKGPQGAARSCKGVSGVHEGCEGLRGVACGCGDYGWALLFTKSVNSIGTLKRSISKIVSKNVLFQNSFD